MDGCRQNTNCRRCFCQIRFSIYVATVAQSRQILLQNTIKCEICCSLNLLLAHWQSLFQPHEIMFLWLKNKQEQMFLRCLFSEFLINLFNKIVIPFKKQKTFLFIETLATSIPPWLGCYRSDIYATFRLSHIQICPSFPFSRWTCSPPLMKPADKKKVFISFLKHKEPSDLLERFLYPHLHLSLVTWLRHWSLQCGLGSTRSHIIHPQDYRWAAPLRLLKNRIKTKSLRCFIYARCKKSKITKTWQFSTPVKYKDFSE